MSPAEPPYEGPPTVMGVPYWTGHLVGVVADTATGERAVAALHAAGFAAADARFWPGATVLRVHEQFMAQRGILQRLGQAVSREEWGHVEEYLASMRQDRAFVSARVPTAERLATARGILVAHGAHPLRHYERSTIEDLPTR